MDQTKQEEEYGYDLFPERNRPKFKKGSIAESLFTFNHKCQVMLQFATETSECPSQVPVHCPSHTETPQWCGHTHVYVHGGCD